MLPRVFRGINGLFLHRLQHLGQRGLSIAKYQFAEMNLLVLTPEIFSVMGTTCKHLTGFTTTRFGLGRIERNSVRAALQGEIRFFQYDWQTTRRDYSIPSVHELMTRFFS